MTPPAIDPDAMLAALTALTGHVTDGYVQLEPGLCVDDDGEYPPRSFSYTEQRLVEQPSLAERIAAAERDAGWSA